MAPPVRDFKKRPKAKVGKRAPVKINATDTTFKTANVAVRSQNHSLEKNKYASTQSSQEKDAAFASAAARMELVSSRGNALSTLQASLRHHAPTVRASGLKGIRDSVQSLSTLGISLGASILETNLPSLLPNMCRCWLDEDDDVRGLAINLFGDIITCLSSSSEQSNLKCLAPFVEFLCAYASSALNSLDRDIRKDGAMIVAILASSDPSPSYESLASSLEKKREISAMSSEMRKHVDLFIPSLERLLSSVSFGGRGRNGTGSKEAGSKKRKNRDGIKAIQPSGSLLAASDSALLSLALLLNASLVTGGKRFSSIQNKTNMSRRLDPSLRVSVECTFLVGGSARANSLSLFREGVRTSNSSLRSIRSIFDLPAISLNEPTDDHDGMHCDEDGVLCQISTSKDSISSIETVQRFTALLETLREKFVELMHSGRKPSHDRDGVIISTSDLDTIDVLVHTMRFVHHHCQSNQTLVDMHDSFIPLQTQKRGKKVTSTIQGKAEFLAAYGATVKRTLLLLMESFPICPMESATTLSRYELSNAGICSALAELGGGQEMLEDSTQTWIDVVFSHVLPRLDYTDVTNDDSEKVASNMLINLVKKLVLPRGLRSGGENYLLVDPLKRYELLESFAATFFPRLTSPLTLEGKVRKNCYIYTTSVSEEVEQRLKQLAPTAAGLTAAMLLTTLITESADRMLDSTSNKKYHKKNSLLFLQMASVLPHYITSWEERQPNETGVVLASLISLARQWSPDGTPFEDNSVLPINMALNDLCLGLRSSLISLYTADKKIPSIFERLPEFVQNLCVGLVGLLKSPSGALVKSLSIICCKSFARQQASIDGPGENVCISKSMATYIIEVVTSLRKTMPMQTYLTFLVDSSGVGHASSTFLSRRRTAGQGGDTPTDQFSYDGSVESLCHSLVSSCELPSEKVLPMILPILQKWLSATSVSTHDTVEQFIQARAASSILSTFVWNEVLTDRSVGIDTDHAAPIFLKLDDNLDSLLVNSIIDQFELSAKLWPDCFEDSEDQLRVLMRLVRPIIVMLRYRDEMFAKFLKAISSRIVRQALATENDSKAEQESAPSGEINLAEVNIKALLLILKSKDPVSIVEFVRSNEELQLTLLFGMEEIDKAVSGGHLAHLGRKLIHHAKLCKL
jgi:pre-rRNA-processing protein IPI1